MSKLNNKIIIRHKFIRLFEPIIADEAIEWEDGKGKDIFCLGL